MVGHCFLLLLLLLMMMMMVRLTVLMALPMLVVIMPLIRAADVNACSQRPCGPWLWLVAWGARSIVRKVAMRRGCKRGKPPNRASTTTISVSVHITMSIGIVIVVVVVVVVIIAIGGDVVVPTAGRVHHNRWRLPSTCPLHARE